MSNEKPNNDFHWKNKLEELESLPGEVFIKEPAWEKLHERMQVKTGKKRAVWYWAAAACVSLAVLIPLALINKNGNVEGTGNLVKTVTIDKKNQRPPIVPEVKKVVPLKERSANVTSVAPKQMVHAPLVVNNIKINSPGNIKIIPEENFANKTGAESMAQEINKSAGLPVDHEITITSLLPEKKKLKVVHINELGQTYPESSSIARSYEHHSLQVKFINQEVFKNPPSSGNTGFNIFKTKNLPSN